MTPKQLDLGSLPIDFPMSIPNNFGSDQFVISEAIKNQLSEETQQS
jgi:hypothetical protein